MDRLITNFYETISVIIFVIGFLILLLNQNLVKKIIGMDMMDGATFIYLVSKGMIIGRRAPIIENGVTSVSTYINPLPSGLVLTGIVVSVCTTAFSLALIQRLYRRYGTVNLDEILIKSKGEKIDE